MPGPQVNLAWTDHAVNESIFTVERSDNGGTFTQIGTVPPSASTGGSVAYVDTNVVAGTTYIYRVAAMLGTTLSGYSNTATVTVQGVPKAPSGLSAAVSWSNKNNERVDLFWGSGATNQTGFEIQGAADYAFINVVYTATAAANATNLNTGNISKLSYYFRIRAVNAVGVSPWVEAIPFPVPAP